VRGQHHAPAARSRFTDTKFAIFPIVFKYYVSFLPQTATVSLHTVHRFDLLTDEHTVFLVKYNVFYSVSHSLPKPAGWRTAAPCRNNQAHYRHTLQTHSISFLTQRTYSYSNFVAMSSLVLELLKKCRVRQRVGHTVYVR